MLDKEKLTGEVWQDLANIIEPYLDETNCSTVRKALTEDLDEYFSWCDWRSISRPDDFNVTTDINGEIEIFWSQNNT